MKDEQLHDKPRALIAERNETHSFPYIDSESDLPIRNLSSSPQISQLVLSVPNTITTTLELSGHKISSLDIAMEIVKEMDRKHSELCNTKESVIASHATLNEILKKADNLDEQMRKELRNLSDNLGRVQENIQRLYGMCENNKEQVNELKVKKTKTEDKITSLDDSMEKEIVNEMDRKHSDHEIRLKEVENYIAEKKSQEQMQVRRKKRMSGDLTTGIASLRSSREGYSQMLDNSS